jgi:hypothetical protein
MHLCIYEAENLFLKTTINDLIYLSLPSHLFLPILEIPTNLNMDKQCHKLEKETVDIGCLRM